MASSNRHTEIVGLFNNLLNAIHVSKHRLLIDRDSTRGIADRIASFLNQKGGKRIRKTKKNKKLKPRKGNRLKEIDHRNEGGSADIRVDCSL